MAAFRLLAKLVLYYAAVAAIVAIVLWLFPGWREYMPIGRVQGLIAQAGETSRRGLSSIHVSHPESFGGSLVWMVSAILGALVTALPVSRVYIEVRNPKDYDQSLIDTIVVLPLVVTSIVVIVQDSLALSFSLAGIAGAARFRNTLKSSGDLLFILLAIGIGLSAGIGAVELAFVTSAAFNLCFVLLWATNYGERDDMKRFLGEFEHVHGHGHGHDHPGTVTATIATATVTEVTETFDAPRPGNPDRQADLARRHEGPLV